VSGRREGRATAATVLAVVALVGAAVLIAYDVFLATRSTGMAVLAVVATHLTLGWIPVVLAVVGLVLRRSRLTVVALIVAVGALVVPPLVALAA
jgi:hypothetical protein